MTDHSPLQLRLQLNEKKTVEQLINLNYEKPELVDLNLIKTAVGMPISYCTNGSGDAVGCGAGAGVFGGEAPPSGP